MPSKPNRMASVGASTLSSALNRAKGVGQGHVRIGVGKAQATSKWSAIETAGRRTGAAIETFVDAEAARQTSELVKRWNSVGARFRSPTVVPEGLTVIGDLSGAAALGRSAAASAARAKAGSAEAEGKTARKAAISDAAASLRNAARTSARTAAATAHNAAVMAIVTENLDKVRAVAAIAVLDERTTENCLELNGGVWDVITGDPIEGESATDLPFPGKPPWHWNCRTQLVPVLAGEPAPTIRTLEDWLAEDPAEAIEALGEERIEAWARGELALSQLVEGKSEAPVGGVEFGKPKSLENQEAWQAKMSASSVDELLNYVRKAKLGLVPGVYSKWKLEAAWVELGTRGIDVAQLAIELSAKGVWTPDGLTAVSPQVVEAKAEKGVEEASTGTATGPKSKENETAWLVKLSSMSASQVRAYVMKAKLALVPGTYSKWKLKLAWDDLALRGVDVEALKDEAVKAGVWVPDALASAASSKKVIDADSEIVGSLNDSELVYALLDNPSLSAEMRAKVRAAIIDRGMHALWLEAQGKSLLAAGISGTEVAELAKFARKMAGHGKDGLFGVLEDTNDPTKAGIIVWLLKSIGADPAKIEEAQTAAMKKQYETAAGTDPGPGSKIEAPSENLNPPPKPQEKPSPDAVYEANGKKFTSAQVKSAALTYSGSSYSDINSGLRKRNPRQIKKWAETIEALDAGIAGNYVGSGTTYGGVQYERRKKVWRGAKAAQFGLKSSKEIEVGAVLQNHAFVSTSELPSVAKAFSGSDIVMEVRLGPESKGLDMTVWSQHKSEREILLARNSQFRVVEVRRSTGAYGETRLVVDHIQPDVDPSSVRLEDFGVVKPSRESIRSARVALEQSRMTMASASASASERAAAAAAIAEQERELGALMQKHGAWIDSNRDERVREVHARIANKEDIAKVETMTPAAETELNARILRDLNAEPAEKDSHKPTLKVAVDPSLKRGEHVEAVQSTIKDIASVVRVHDRTTKTPIIESTVTDSPSGRAGTAPNAPMMIPTKNSLGGPISKQEVAAHVAHEFGHQMEFRNPVLALEARRFLEMRLDKTERKELTPLSEADAALGYKRGSTAEERVIADEFIDPYMGKVTSKGEAGNILALKDAVRSSTATELVSMSLEMMLTQPARFAARDPEMFDWATRVLRGHRVLTKFGETGT